MKKTLLILIIIYAGQDPYGTASCRDKGHASEQGGISRKPGRECDAGT